MESYFDFVNKNQRKMPIHASNVKSMYMHMIPRMHMRNYCI